MAGRCEGDLAAQLLQEHFGTTVARVGQILLREHLGLPQLVLRLRKHSISLNHIRQSLILLHTYGLLKWRADGARVIYSMPTSETMHLASWARVCYLTKTVFASDAAETIVDELLTQGRLSCSDCVRRVVERGSFEQDDVLKAFTRLAESSWIARYPQIIGKSGRSGCPIPDTEQLHNVHQMPDKVLDRVEAVKETSHGRKRKAQDQPDSDADIHWHVHWPRIVRYERNEATVNALLVTRSVIPSQASQALEAAGKEAVHALLRINELRSSIKLQESVMVSLYDIERNLKENGLDPDRDRIENALRWLSNVEEPQNAILRKAGDSAGGLYIVDFERAIQATVRRMAECVARERLDSRAVRLFRLLIKKGYLDEDEVARHAMITPKEAREQLYAMCEEGLVCVRHLGRTQDFAPARTVFLFHVDMGQVAQQLCEYTAKAQRNAMLRRLHEQEEHRALLEKQMDCDNIAAAIKTSASNQSEEEKDAQIAELDANYLSAAEKTRLAKFAQSKLALLAIEIELARQLQLLHLYLQMERLRC